MDTGRRESVLACVTLQCGLERIIDTAKKIADDTDCELRVLSVLRPTNDYTKISNQLEYLDLVSKQAGADMTVVFSDDPAKIAADFAKKNNVSRIVTGMHDGGEKSFLVKFNELSPLTPITMLAKDNMIYSMDICRSYS